MWDPDELLLYQTFCASLSWHGRKDRYWISDRRIPDRQIPNRWILDRQIPLYLETHSEVIRKKAIFSTCLGA